MQVKVVIFPFLIGCHFLFASSILLFFFFWRFHVAEDKRLSWNEILLALSWKCYLLILVQLLFSLIINNI